MTFCSQVALKRFVDDIATEVVEMKLLCTLPGIFNPVTAFDMSDELVTQIAGESEESRSLREQLNKKLHVLAKGSDTCRRFVGIRGIGKKLATPSRIETNSIKNSQTKAASQTIHVLPNFQVALGALLRKLKTLRSPNMTTKMNTRSL